MVGYRRTRRVGDASLIPEQEVVVDKGNSPSWQIRNAGVTETISKDVFRTNVMELNKKNQVPIHLLSDNTKNIFNIVKKQLEAAKNDPSVHAEMINICHSIFNINMETMPMTIQAYFVGCFKPSAMGEFKGCSPICVGNLLPISGQVGVVSCPDNYLDYTTDGNLSRIVDNEESDVAWIHIYNAGNNKFYESDIARLKKYGIRYVHFIFITWSGDYKFTERTSVDDIISLPDIDTVDRKAEESTMHIGWLVGLFIVALFLMIVLYMVYKGSWLTRPALVSTPVIEMVPQFSTTTC